jgi:hypothetical protein
MAMETGQTSVGTALVKLAGPFGAAATIHLHLHDNTETVYIGPDGITASTGLRLAKQDHVDLDLGQGDALYAIASATGPATISWLAEYN